MTLVWPTNTLLTACYLFSVSAFSVRLFKTLGLYRSSTAAWYHVQFEWKYIAFSSFSSKCRLAAVLRPDSLGKLLRIGLCDKREGKGGEGKKGEERRGEAEIFSNARHCGRMPLLPSVDLSYRRLRSLCGLWSRRRQGVAGPQTWSRSVLLLMFFFLGFWPPKLGGEQ